MPIYEYQCKACEHELEVLQKMSDKPLRKCPECGRLQLQRLISAPVFRLKGGGWYETDFKSDKDNKRNIAGDADKAAADSGKSESGAGEKSAETKTGDAESAAAKPAKAKDAAGPKSGPGSDDKSREKSGEKSAGSGKSGGKNSSSAVA